MTSHRMIRPAAFLALAAATGLAQANPSTGWDWMIAPYGWIVNIGADMETTTPPSGISNDTAFDDLLDKFDGAFEIHAEGQGDDFGVFTDFTYLGLASGRDRRFFHTESDLDSRLFELAGFWSPGTERGRGIEVFGGLRMIDIDFTAQLIPENPAFAPAVLDTNETFSDFMLGARYTWALSDRWALTLRGDGSWGDTDGTWNASAVAQYRTRNGAWLFGYRYLTADFETRGNALSLELFGPEIGYAFRF
jgi:hypothetical protein